MQRLQSIFRRAALALALFTTGVAGGYALHDPAAVVEPCRAQAATPESQHVYAALWADARVNASHADCSCGSA